MTYLTGSNLQILPQTYMQPRRNGTVKQGHGFSIVLDSKNGRPGPVSVWRSGDFRDVAKPYSALPSAKLQDATPQI